MLNIFFFLQIIFEAIRGPSLRSDMAIDDISFRRGPCEGQCKSFLYMFKSRQMCYGSITSTPNKCRHIIQRGEITIIFYFDNGICLDAHICMMSVGKH